MTPFVLLDTGRPARVEANVDGNAVWIDAADIEAALGWELRPEGLCKDDVCMPVAGNPDLVAGGAINLRALMKRLGRPMALSEEAGVAYLGPPLALYEQTVMSLDAPDFSLPDLDGHVHSLSQHRGSKVLLAAWASW